MEGTGPAPDGNVWTGYDECLAGWQGLASDPAIQFRSSTSTSTATEPSSAGGSPAPQNYRGVNLMRVRDGKIVEALGYGKRP